MVIQILHVSGVLSISRYFSLYTEGVPVSKGIMLCNRPLSG